MRTAFFSCWFYRNATCFTLCAVFFTALLPSIGHTAKRSSEKIWFEICSTQGLKVIALDVDNDTSPSQASVNAFCPLCLLQSDHPSLFESGTKGQWSVHKTNTIAIQISINESPTIQIWAAHYTRGPPRLSWIPWNALTPSRTRRCLTCWSCAAHRSFIQSSFKIERLSCMSSLTSWVWLSTLISVQP
jgi:hypothetical protein